MDLPNSAYNINYAVAELRDALRSTCQGGDNSVCSCLIYTVNTLEGSLVFHLDTLDNSIKTSKRHTQNVLRMRRDVLAGMYASGDARNYFFQDIIFPINIRVERFAYPDFVSVELSGWSEFLELHDGFDPFLSAIAFCSELATACCDAIRSDNIPVNSIFFVGCSILDEDTGVVLLNRIDRDS